ncbi:hypothetical protein D6D19_08883 [Aureobasidium pullulans]|uniref:NmrA-like domain-containing protein n=2 Tax=Aureobasidium pullulans TaxID=5580 RepID=A0A4S8ZQJ3_AURPU|nr:hypothetical protein D6D23_09830 [Aureobasidium pullulans]THW68495.1 hypothetical protein D6D19_08883 [Aureobasidium pullulans]THY37207.1 hypothetical protein D6C99_09843 [Aureobasidium pullulans]TIA06080.1 hypothetical protein D6C81_10072 [Aureobasidium pullulans]TIA71731.1 hypothetical protein D6C76_07132 [Aureobasidium pullulans]
MFIQRLFPSLTSFTLIKDIQIDMTKTITVCGATGTVGNSVALRLLKEGWKVRAITRNKSSDAAKALFEAGAELATADYNDITSLESAFQDTHAIFGITNIFEYLMENGPDAAAEKEAQQLINIATAASRILSLEHLILHTLPAGEKLSGKGNFGKDKAADVIKQSLPAVAEKTTFMWLGFFTSNFYENPMLKPIEMQNAHGSHVFIQPANPSLHFPFAGDVSHNVGIFVSAILNRPDISLPAKYAFMYTSQGTFQDYLQAWINVTGRKTVFVPTSLESYEQMWGPFGKEIGLMFKAFAGVDDWTVPYGADVVTAVDLGIPEDTLIDLQPALQKVAEKL